MGTKYCVEWADDKPPAATTSTTTSTVTTTTIALSGPSPTQSGVVNTCTQFYKVQFGDTCIGIVNKHGTFTLEEFLKWNPTVGQGCGGLWLDYYVCVGIPGLPTSRQLTSTTTGPSGPSPTQYGIEKTCQRYYKAESGDTCQKIVDKYTTFTLDDFYKWNSAVNTDCSALLLDFYYCIGVPRTPSSATTTSLGPQPTQAGTIKNCKQFYKVKPGDYCQMIVELYQNRFTLEQFYSWNPAVKTDCSSLWLNYYVCVGV